MNQRRRLAFPTFLLAGAFAAPSACVEAGNGAPPPGYEIEGSGGSSTAGTSPGGSGGSSVGGSAGSGQTNGSGGNAGSGDTSGSGGSGPDPFASGAELRVSVNALGRSFVRLDPLSLVTPATPADSPEWDLAFEGYDVFTNGGASGVSQGAAFGPFEAADFASSVVPVFPFFLDDKTGGAFLSWYKYDGAGGHLLWPRYHVYGLKDGASYWKVQITSYYSERDNFPTPALYAVRYASIGPDSVGDTQEVIVDGT
ncbi:MAG: HmuY family protein, partial [Polyangiaceae bacterium]|nr:HmuY family protein [Polyangiaceae bacterium]